MRNFDELSEREMLALAISNEEEDSRIFMRILADVENHPASAQVFSEMAAEENEHRRRLIDLLRLQVRRAYPAHSSPGRPRLYPAEAVCRPARRYRDGPARTRTNRFPGRRAVLPPGDSAHVRTSIRKLLGDLRR